MDYKIEYALFEIWGAIQTASNIYEVKIVAEEALKNLGFIEKDTEE